MKLIRSEKNKDNKSSPSVKESLESGLKKSSKGFLEKSDDKQAPPINKPKVDPQKTTPNSLLDLFDKFLENAPDQNKHLIKASLIHLEQIGIDIHNLDKYDEKKHSQYLSDFQIESLKDHKKLLEKLKREI